MEVVDAGFEGADGLEQALLKGATDAHGLAGGLHLGGEAVVGVGKLVEGEAGHLGDDVVEGRLEAGRGVGNGDLVEGHAHGDLGRDPGDGIAAGLGGQSRGPGDAGVDLDQVVAEGLGIQGELDVAAALDAEGADQLKRAAPQKLVLLVGQGLAGADDDGVTGMDAHGVEVLHVADGDGRVIAVADDLVLDLLVALDALFDKNLMDGRELEGVLHQEAELLLVVGEAAAGAAEGESGTEHHGIADLFGGLQALFHGAGDLRGQHRLADGGAQLLEQFPVLGLLDGGAGGAQQLDLALPQDALALELHGKVQAGLAADTGDDGVGPLIADDLGDVLEGQRLHVDLVGDGLVGHDGGGVGVDEDDLVALLPQGQTGLGTGIVELGGLADDNGAGADDHDFVDVSSFRHGGVPPPSDAEIHRTGRCCPGDQGRSRGDTGRKRPGRLRTGCPRRCRPAGSGG